MFKKKKRLRVHHAPMSHSTAVRSSNRVAYGSSIRMFSLLRVIEGGVGKDWSLQPRDACLGTDVRHSDKFR